jgi:hypothetical protein
MKAIDIGRIQTLRARLVQEIAQRRQEIAALQAALQEEIISFESRLADLDAAERVLAELESETTDAENAPTPLAEMSEPELFEAAAESEEVHPGAADPLVSGAAAGRKAKARNVSPKIAKALDLWLRPSEEISAAEIGKVVGLSTRTLYNRLGPREAARQSAHPGDIDIIRSNECPPDRETGHPIKPEGIPMVPEMIIEALNCALSDGRAGLRVSELIAFIRDRYWPDAPTNSVGPVAWRMSKTGELQNNNSVYSLPNEYKSTQRKRHRTGDKKEPLKRPRRRQQSLADRAAQECIRIIRERGQPVSGRDLCAVLAQRGIRFRGKTSPVQRLAHCLSLSPELVGDHSRGNKTRGWSLKEWENASDPPAEHDEPPSPPIQLHPTWEEEAAE